MTTHADPDELVAKLYKDTQVADSWDKQKIRRSFNQNGKEIIED